MPEPGASAEEPKESAPTTGSSGIDADKCEKMPEEAQASGTCPQNLLEMITDTFPGKRQDIRSYSALSLAYIGDKVYEKLTGKNAYDSIDRAAYEKLEQELARDIQYGEGIGYPYTWSETADYLPKLCGKYLTPEDLATLIQYHNDTWNPTSREVQQARKTAVKEKKRTHRGGDAR